MKESDKEVIDRLVLEAVESGYGHLAAIENNINRSKISPSSRWIRGSLQRMRKKNIVKYENSKWRKA